MLQEQKGENLSIGFVAKFFDKTTYWIRWCESRNYFTYLNGESIIPMRKSAPEGGRAQRRIYSFQNIADMADSLYRLGRITQAEHTRIITRVAIMRR